MITRSSQCRTVVDLVRLRADIAADRPAYTYLTDGEAEERTLTWHDVDVRARALAAWLGRLSGRRERMVLLFPTGLEFVTTFFGCLYAGVAAVPAYLLDPLHLERTRARLRVMLDDCRPSRILTTTAYRGVVLSMFDDRSHLDGFEWGLVDTVPDDLASAWRPPEIDGNTLAIIQYTSGAIANPKGVLVSHRNVLANEAMIAGAHGYEIETTFVSWLPLAHDWGLINSIVQPAYSGGRSVLMSTEAFLEKPVRWLRAMSGCRSVSSGGPNFAYDFCCRRIAPEQRIGLDLVGWRWAGVSAGPVSSETLAAFSSAFQPFGFTASAFYSGYGLAEATLLVSDSERFQVPRVLIVDRASLQKGLIVPRVAVDPSTTQSFTSCGTPPAVERVRIVDPETRAVRPDDQVGEIWVAGDNVAGGYWNRPVESQQTFGGITADGDGPFLRTGDLGFFHHGELYICGRLKDLIIIRGRNIYPHDIESTAEHSHPSARPGSSVAFAIDTGADERVVVLQELRPVAPGSPRHDAEIADAIRTAIVGVHGLIAEVVLVEPGTIRKTSSGKLRRNACREAFLAGELDVRYDQTPAKEQERLHLEGGSRVTTSVDAGMQTIGVRLAKLASRFPERIAVVEGSSAVTFRQLDTAATAIAHAIVAVRQGLPGRVCLFFENRAPAIKAIFGAGRSGYAYVPVDAGDPEERLRNILLDSEPVALLTEQCLLDRARTITPPGCTVIDIAGLQPIAQVRPLPEVPSDAPVYLYYTSGSTGRPKGAIQTHRNLLFFADAYARALAIGEHDRLSLLYTLSFNAANMDIFGGLLSGATLCAYDMRRESVARLADWLDRERITVLHTVPTVFREMGNRLPPDRLLSHLRVIDLGGESVFAGDVDLFRAHTQARCVFVNQLAATEVGLIAQHKVEHNSLRNSGSIVPVGRCPDGVRVEIRRDDGGAAEAGEAGEIVVCSPYVSPGYWRRPELDAVAFAADARDARSRRYFTGDLGRIDEQGVLHFLGRKGSRVKIRGHTVDLAEVEAGLAACAGVTKVAVLAVGSERPAQPERLVAYLVMAREAERDPALILGRLASVLPSYMLPAGYVFLDALPLTASGKIDRKALAAMDRPEPNEEREIEPPRDDLERSIAGIFAQMLKLAPIGRNDDFFLLGGDSLSVAELQTRLRDTFGVGLANPSGGATVAGIAAEIRRERAAAGGSVRSIPLLIPLRRHGTKTPLFLVHGRLGQALVSPHFLDLLGADQPVWGFQATGLDGLRSPQPTIEAMAAEYLAEMRRERPQGPYFLGGLCAGALVAIAMGRRLRAEGESVLPLLLLDPPERAFPVSAEKMTDDGLLARLKRRQESGAISAPIDDPVYAGAAVRAARAFEHAIRAHEVQPYEGPVCILSSHERLAGIDSSRLKKIFPGRVERFEVGRTHPEVLDPHNRAFAKALERCLSVIHEYADDPRLPHLARADSPNAIP